MVICIPICCYPVGNTIGNTKENPVGNPIGNTKGNTNRIDKGRKTLKVTNSTLKKTIREPEGDTRVCPYRQSVT